MSYKGSGPPSRTGSATNRPGSGRVTATASRSTTQSKTSITKMQATVVQKTGSSTKIQTQSRITATTVTKLPPQPSGSRQGFDARCAATSAGAARIRMASKTSKDSKPSVQTTKVVVTGTGLKPTGKVDTQSCKAKCAKRTPADPLLQPFTEEVERGRPVPAGMYYIPISGAPDQGLGPDEKKLRTKLQKYTPAALSHWKVQATDPFARKVGPLKQVHPDIVSGTFRSVQGSYQPEYVNPQLEQRLDPSLPEPNWSLSLREAMSHESGVYEEENPVDGQKEQYTVENTVIERQIAAELPASSSPGPCGRPSSGSAERPSPSSVRSPYPAPCARSSPVHGMPSSSPGPSGPSSSGFVERPSPNSVRPPCPAPCARSSPVHGMQSSSPDPSGPSSSGYVDRSSPSSVRPPCPAPCARSSPVHSVPSSSPDPRGPSSSGSSGPPSPGSPGPSFTQATRMPCKAKCSIPTSSPADQPVLPATSMPQTRTPPPLLPPTITVQPPTPFIPSPPTITMQSSPAQLQPMIQSPCRQRVSDYPESEHTVNVQMVPAPRMQSPTGEIDAQKTIYLQRLLQASSQGTKVLTSLRGTNLVSPCQAKQIDIMKQENLPPPSPPRPLTPQVTSAHRPISPQLQYVMPPRDACYSPQIHTMPSPRRGYPLPGPYASPPPSPLLTQRGPSPQGYTPPMYGMMTQQRSPVPVRQMSPFIQPSGSGQRLRTSDMGYAISPCSRSAGPGQRPVMAQGGSPYLQVPDSGRRPVTPELLQGGSQYLQVPGSGPKSITPIKIPLTPSKMVPPISPIRLEAAAPVPQSPAEASLDIVRRLVDEERQDVVISQELPPPLTRKLNKLKKKPQSMRVLEETLDQSVPIDEESEALKSDVIAELMYSQETGVINPASSPRKTYEQLFPPLADQQPIAVSPAAPAPLHDIVVPVGEATIDSVAVVNEDIQEISEAVAEGNEQIPQANAFAEAIKNDTEGQLASPSRSREHKSNEKQPPQEEAAEEGAAEEGAAEEGAAEEGAAEEGAAEESAAEEGAAKEKATDEEDAEYIPRGELEEQKAPWDIKLGSLEDLVGGKMSMMSSWDNLPSDESVRATAGRLEYVLDVQKPLHHSCVQLRGSQMPAWFPGFYSVLPQVDGYVRLERTPSRAFASAWHVFAPYQSAEQSEVVIL